MYACIYMHAYCINAKFQWKFKAPGLQSPQSQSTHPHLLKPLTQQLQLAAAANYSNTSAAAAAAAAAEAGEAEAAPPSAQTIRTMTAARAFAFNCLY